MQIIGNCGSIKRIDDAISTTPESTIQAIRTFGKEINTIFLGGTDRGYDFRELADYILDYDIKNIIFFPDSGARIYEDLKNNKLRAKKSKDIKVFFTRDMRDAVRFAYDNTAK